MLPQIVDEFELMKNIMAELLLSVRQGVVYPSFSGKSYNEVEQEIKQIMREQEIHFSFKMLAFTESRIKSDFAERTGKNLKDRISQQYKEIKSQTIKNKARKKDGKSLLNQIDVEDLLKAWKAMYRDPNISKVVGDFNWLYNFRHWVAHGRSGNYNLSEQNDVSNTFRVCNGLLQLCLL